MALAPPRAPFPVKSKDLGVVPWNFSALQEFFSLPRGGSQRVLWGRAPSVPAGFQVRIPNPAAIPVERKHSQRAELVNLLINQHPALPTDGKRVGMAGLGSGDIPKTPNIPKKAPGQGAVPPCALRAEDGLVSSRSGISTREFFN